MAHAGSRTSDASFIRVALTHPDAVALAARATAEGDRVYADKRLRASPPRLEEVLQGGGRVLVGYLAGEPIACGAVRILVPGLGEIKRMFVAPACRGRGIGRRLLLTLEGEAVERGCTRVRLDTGSRQRAALALYRSSGYAEIDDYNRQPGAEHWFEKRFR